MVIIGAGPAGSTTSAFLCKEKIPHIIIDKAIFPRDKICGDALSGKVIPIFKKLDPSYLREMKADTTHFIPSYGIKFAAPNGKFIDIPFGKNGYNAANPPGFISKRLHFDNFLFNKIDREFADVRQGHELISVKRVDKKLSLTIKHENDEYELICDLVIAAEGERSVIAKALGNHIKEDAHFCGGIRAYYKDVKNMHEHHFIELHFLKEMLPGYFWIFPLPGGYANVGAGMLSSAIKKKKVNLREAMLKAIKDSATIKDRFSEATLEGKIQGWGLPLGSVKRKLSGDNFMLSGDAASMIDPFSGEGISNAMYCGMTAAFTAIEALNQSQYDEKFLRQYDEKVYHRLWSELRLSHAMQKLCNYPGIFNFIINKAEKNEAFRETISCMFDDLDLRAKFRKPSFYFNLLFNDKV